MFSCFPPYCCRLVGIISHVAELKERIDKQVVVTKHNLGGGHATVKA